MIYHHYVFDRDVVGLVGFAVKLVKLLGGDEILEYVMKRGIRGPPKPASRPRVRRHPCGNIGA